MIDKYKIAAVIKKENPTMTHREVLEITDEVVKIYFDSKCTVEEAIEKAKEMIADGRNETSCRGV